MPVQHGPVGPFPPGADPEEYDKRRRRVLWAMPAGLYLVGSRSATRRNLMTCNWVSQVATDPKLVAVGIDAEAVTAALIREGGRFSVCLLARGDRALVRKFVKPVAEVETDREGVATTMAGVAVEEVAGGLPVAGASVGWLACTVREQLPLGSHDLFVGEVDDVGGVLGDADADADVLRMEDTRMSYGG